MFKGLYHQLFMFLTVVSNLHINSSNYGVAAHTDIFNRYQRIRLLTFCHVLLLICNTNLCICTNALVKFRHVSKILLHNQRFILINTNTVFLKQYNNLAFSFCTKSTLCLNLLVVLNPLNLPGKQISNNYPIIQNNYAEYIITSCMICCCICFTITFKIMLTTITTIK